jgi:hypothetical protein
MKLLNPARKQFTGTQPLIAIEHLGRHLQVPTYVLLRLREKLGLPVHSHEKQEYVSRDEARELDVALRMLQNGIAWQAIERHSVLREIRQQDYGLTGALSPVSAIPHPSPVVNAPAPIEMTMDALSASQGVRSSIPKPFSVRKAHGEKWLQHHGRVFSTAPAPPTSASQPGKR